MTKIKQVIRAIYSTEAIYKLREMPIFLTILIGIVCGILHMTPFTLRLFEVQTYRFDLQMWSLDHETQEELLYHLPGECYFLNGIFNCNQIDSFTVGEDIDIHFSYVDTDIENGIIFSEDSFVFIAQQQRYVLHYQTLDGLSFGELQGLYDGYDILFDGIAAGLQGVLIVPFVLNVYQTGVVSFFVYILGISALSMVLKFGHPKFITFKEMLNIMVLSSLLPIVAMIIAGLFTPAFSMIIFNMATPIWAYVVYKKHVVPNLQNSSN